MGPRNHVLDGGPYPPWEDTIFGRRSANCKVATFCCELCKNGFTDRDAVWHAELGEPKEPRRRWRYRSPGKGQFWGGRACRHAPTCPTTLWRELCKNGWTDRDAVWLVTWTRVGPRKHY